MRALLIALCLPGCYSTYGHRHADYVPHEISYEDGQPAYQVGPFASRTEMRETLGTMCQRSGGGYELLDSDDEVTTHSRARGVAVGYTTVARSEATERHAITVTFRCK